MSQQYDQWTDFERAFPYTYTLPPVEAAQRAGQTPREAAEFAAYYATYANAPLTAFLANPSAGALAAEVFASYYLGESLILQKQRDPAALAQAVTALDDLEACRPLTDAEEWQRVTFLSILTGMGTDFVGPDRGGGGGGGGFRRYAFELLEDDDGMRHVIGMGPKGRIEFVSEESIEGTILYMRRFDIEGPGAGSMGRQELDNFVSEYGRSRGVEAVVIEGGRRTTGKYKGQFQRPWTVKVK